MKTSIRFLIAPLVLIVSMTWQLQAQQKIDCKGRKQKDFEKGIYMGYKFSAITDTGEYFKEQTKRLFPEDSELHIPYSIIYDLVFGTNKTDSIKLFDGQLLNKNKSTIVNFKNSNFLSNWFLEGSFIYQQHTEEVPSNDIYGNDTIEVDTVFYSYNVVGFELFEEITLIDTLFQRSHLFLNIQYKRQLGNTYLYQYYLLDLTDRKTQAYLNSKKLIVGVQQVPFYDWLASGAFKARMSFVIDGKSPPTDYFAEGMPEPTKGYLTQEYYKLGKCVADVKKKLREEAKKSNSQQ